MGWALEFAFDVMMIMHDAGRRSQALVVALFTTIR